MSAAAEPVVAPRAAAAPKLYRASALASGFVRMWRGWRVMVPVIVLNALIQALLVLPAYSVEAVALNAVFAVLSALVALASLVLVTIAAQQAIEGTSTWSQVVSADRRTLGLALIWAVALVLVLTVGFSLWTLPGILIAAVTPFVLIAAVAGKRNPLVANFRTIGRRFWRWLVTALITSALLLVGTLGSGFVVFFLRGMLGAGLVWLAVGVVAAWFTTAWTLIYWHSLEQQ